MPQFHVDKELHPGKEVTILGEDYKHLAIVRRVKAGQNLYLRDNKNTLFKGRIVNILHDSINVVIDESIASEKLTAKLTLGAALLKGDSFEYALRKAAEVGVNEFVPILTERCVPKIDGNKLDKKVERWEKISLEASKQSMNFAIMTVSYPVKFEDFLSNHKNEISILADINSNKTLSSINFENCENASLIIGPEGGFSVAELQSAKDLGWEILKFPFSQLKAETAIPVLSAIIIHELNKDYVSKNS